MRYAPQVAWQIIDGEVMIVDLASGQTMGLNPTATWLWSHLDGHSASELTDEMTSAFDVSRNDAEKDVNEFIQLLREKDLIADS